MSARLCAGRMLGILIATSDHTYTASRESAEILSKGHTGEQSDGGDVRLHGESKLSK